MRLQLFPSMIFPTYFPVVNFTFPYPMEKVTGLLNYRQHKVIDRKQEGKIFSNLKL
jgi:hypothetical protein